MAGDGDQRWVFGRWGAGPPLGRCSYVSPIGPAWPWAKTAMEGAYKLTVSASDGRNVTFDLSREMREYISVTEVLCGSASAHIEIDAVLPAR